MTEHLDSTNLVPFKKRRHSGYHLPGMKKEDDGLIDAVDPELSPEDQMYVRHYLSYADILLKNAGTIETGPSDQSETLADREKVDEKPGLAAGLSNTNGSKNRAA
jgi:hypothetical protein